VGANRDYGSYHHSEVISTNQFTELQKSRAEVILTVVNATLWPDGVWTLAFYVGKLVQALPLAAALLAQHCVCQMCISLI